MVSIYNQRFRPRFICPYCIRAEFVCPYCGAKFSTREALRVHIYNSHIEKFDEFVDELRNTSFTDPLMKENEDNCYESQSQQIYVDNDYLCALKTADKYLYAWMTRDGSMAYDLVSDNIKKKYKDKEDFKMDFAGLSNPHHECFEIVGCKCRSKNKIRFKVWMYYHYTGANESPINRPENNACIELLKINEEKWLVDKVLESPESLCVCKFTEKAQGPCPCLEGASELALLRGKAVSVTLPVPSGATWITTDGNQTVYFKYYGLVTRVIIWKPSPHGAKYYDGPPIPSWNSPGFFGLNLEGSGNVVYSTIIPG